MGKTIFEGRRYNTKSATLVAEGLSSGGAQGDFKHWHGDLYKTPKGQFFLEGAGGAMTMFCRTAGPNTWSGGSGIKVLGKAEALYILENQHRYYGDEIEAHFQDILEDA